MQRHHSFCNGGILYHPRTINICFDASVFVLKPIATLLALNSASPRLPRVEAARRLPASGRLSSLPGCRLTRRLISFRRGSYWRRTSIKRNQWSRVCMQATASFVLMKLGCYSLTSMSFLRDTLDFTEHCHRRSLIVTHGPLQHAANSV